MVRKMKAFVTSIGEITTELCVWSLERNGFDVHLIENGSLLSEKLEHIYNRADDDFVRVDADVVVNKTFTPSFVNLWGEKFPDAWWLQFKTFGWFKLNEIYGGGQYVKKEALPALRDNVKDYHEFDRPETELSRLREFYDPRRFDSVTDGLVGLHGFAANDIDRVIEQKRKRKNFEEYDFELAAKLEGLLK